MGDAPGVPSPTAKKSFVALFKHAEPSASQDLPNPSHAPHGVEHAVKFPQKHVDSLSKHFNFAIISEFSYGRLTMERSHQIFNKLGLKGSFSLGNLDSKNMLIRHNQEWEFNRIWLRDLWYIDGFPMRIYRWSIEFHPDLESSINPVWDSLPNLSIFLFDKNVSFPMESSLEIL